MSDCSCPLDCIEKIQILHLEPEDMVLVKLAGVVSQNVIDRILPKLRVIFPKNEVAIVGSGIDISVERSSTNAGRSD